MSSSQRHFTGERQQNLTVTVRSLKIVRGVFYINGKRIQKKLFSFSELDLDDDGFARSKTKKAARLLDSKIRRRWNEIYKELLESPPDTPKKPNSDLSMKEAFILWISANKPLKHTRTIVDHYSLLSVQYLNFVGNHKLSSFSIRHVDRFISAAKSTNIKDTTVNSKLRSLRTFLNWCKDRDLLDQVPKIQFLKTVKRIPKVLSEDQLKSLEDRLSSLFELATTPKTKLRYFHQILFLKIAVSTGFRLQEIFWLKWDQVDFDRCSIMVRSTSFTIKEKKEKERFIPSHLLDFLRQIKNDRPNETWLFDDGLGNLAYKKPSYFSSTFTHHFQALGFSRQGIKVLHGFRALFATRLRNDLNIDSRTIQQLLGHADIKTTEAYFSDLDVQQKAAIAALNERFLSTKA